MEDIDLNIFKSLNEHKVRYILVGGIACILYGSPRITKDTDILIEATLENSARLLDALKAVGFGTADLTTPKGIVKNEVTMFRDYVYLDVLTKVRGIAFQKAWAKRVIKRIKGVRIPLAHIDDLILSKRAAGRDMDLGDIKILQKIKKQKR
jgi:predicted nucleotidyltransferase